MNRLRTRFLGLPFLVLFYSSAALAADGGVIISTKRSPSMLLESLKKLDQVMAELAQQAAR